MSDEKLDEVKTEKSLTAKQIKKLAKPEFAANPDKFYPTKTLQKLGFQRAQCPKCQNNFWRHTPKKETCGDSQCEQRYSFIGVGTGRGRKGNKITYAEAWEGFRKSLSSARVPCTPIKRYPVVARWRSDVDYVAAGIFCFQPYCVTGELEPPANPLICPQFCLRFNDLDNIGLTGRHYSGFIMLGIQVFNLPGKYKFWMDECVEFNYRWLTEELGIDPDEITFIEDVWAGGGNLGPSIEYFVNGLELGNMVFMQFKTFPDGRREPLKVQVIDVGIGLERVPWLINGSPTSYVDVFPRSLDFFLDKIGEKIDSDVWKKYGPFSCLLNADEVEDLDKTWKWIGEKIGMEASVVKKAIEPIRDAYIVLDHCRCVLMAVTDGSLPSNVGGAANVRNVLRRVFAILKNRGWWDKLGMEGLLTLFEKEREDLATIYGKFEEYPSFAPIIKLEYERWRKTDGDQQKNVKALLAKRKDGKLTIDDWIVLIQSHGIPADAVAALTKQEVPGNLYIIISERAEQLVPVMPTVLYSTEHLPETVAMYYRDNSLSEFDAKIVAVLHDVQKKNEPSIVILNQSVFYPTSGGQDHDTGGLTIQGVTYKVRDATKVGPCVLHYLDTPLPARDLNSWVGMPVRGWVDMGRREQLRNHHTATHIVYASCRKVLGPHVWQNGAKKTVDHAHLDITHFQSTSREEIIAIQKEANRIVQKCKEINKGFMAKDEAEKKYGFHLYQGGVVPGNELRVVSIADTDTEACCGTHCDNTAEVGTIKILKSSRLSDGIVRLTYVAGEKALDAVGEDETILQSLIADWQVSGKGDVIKTGTKFFEGYKKGEAVSRKQGVKILGLQLKNHLLDPTATLAVMRSDEAAPTLYMGALPENAQKMKDTGKGIAFVGPTYFVAIVGDPSKINVKRVEDFMAASSDDSKEAKEKKDKKDKKKEKYGDKAAEASTDAAEKDKDKVAKKAKLEIQSETKGKNGVKDIVFLKCMGLPKNHKFYDLFVELGFKPEEE